MESAALMEGWEFRPAHGVCDFPRTGWGHRGYEEQAVDEFVQRVDHELAAAGDQINDLRLEVDRLHRYIRRQWAAVAAAESASALASGQEGESSRVATPAAQARAVLTQAQEIAERRLAEASARLAESERVAQARLVQADRQVAERLAETDELVTLRLREADAASAQRLDRVDSIADEVLGDARREAVRKRFRTQDDARRLITMARSRYEEIVIRAHRRADEAADVALHDFEDAAYQTGNPARARAELEMKAAYLRTFATVSRTALQAALEITSREFDRLLGASAAIELGQPGPGPASTGPVAAVPGDAALVTSGAAHAGSGNAGPSLTLAPRTGFHTAPGGVPVSGPSAAGHPGIAPPSQAREQIITLPGDSGTMELVRISHPG